MVWTEKFLLIFISFRLLGLHEDILSAYRNLLTIRQLYRILTTDQHMKGYSKTTSMKRIASILRRAGAISPLAMALGVNRVTLSSVLRGKTTSARLLAAAEGRRSVLPKPVVVMRRAA